MESISFTTTTTETVVTRPDYISYFQTEAYKREKMAVIIFLVTFSLVGTVGNGLVLLVYMRKSKKVTSTIFILSLAWVDFLTCLIHIPCTITFIVLDGNLVYDVICKLYQLLNSCSILLSTLLIVAVAVDRYFKICHPLLIAVTPRRAVISIVFLCLFAVCIGIVIACLYGVYHGSAYVLDGNYSAGMDHNATLVDPISSISRGNEDTHYCTQRHHHHPCNSKTTPSAKTQSPQPGRSTSETDTTYVYTGICNPNFIIFSKQFWRLVYGVYQSCFILSVLTVFILYFLLFRTVVKSRAWRRKHTPMIRPPINPVCNNARIKATPARLVPDGQHEDGVDVEQNPKMVCSSEDENGGSDVDIGYGGSDTGSYKLTWTETPKARICGCKQTAVGSGRDQKKDDFASRTGDTERMTSRQNGDADLLANIRTAFLLFVVTVVFIMSFMPACLMTLKLIGFHLRVFFMFYINNVANPVIYAFMNKSFREDLKQVFQRRTYLPRNS